jgi:hypothetical protein
MLRTAQQLAAYGLHVFPCAVRGKTPATPHGYLDATTDAVQIDAWWQENASYNLAIATGSISKVFVIDTDTADAEVALTALGELPKSVTVLTAKGRHRYFSMPPGLKMGCSVRKLVPGVGIDIRADGGYVLSPPSVHPSGLIYKWDRNGVRTFAAAPQWLLDKIVAIKGNGNGQCRPSSEWRQLVTDGVDEGQRDESVTRLSGYLLRRYVDSGVVRQLVGCWNELRCRPPLPTEEIDRIVDSIAGREQGKRNGIR